MSELSWRSKPSTKQRRRFYRPRLEVMEDRLAPATFTVTTTAPTGPGSLTAAIVDANHSTGADHIEFNIPTS